MTQRPSEGPRYVIDGSFLATRPTGLHRVARALAAAAIEAGLPAEVWAPRGTDDPLVDRTLPTGTGRVGRRLWEQVVLPANARGRTIVSLTNTAPLVAPGVVLVHDLAPLVGPQWFVGSMRLYAATVLAAARRAQLVVTVSDAVRGELVGHGVARDRIAVVAPAIDDRFAPASTAAVKAARAAFGLHRPYAVLVGWTNPRKDAATAVAAHRLVARDVPHDLVLVGGPDPTFAPVAVPSLPSVHRLGHVIDRQLVALLTGAAVALYPSRYEGYGLPPLEAMACGTPAVVSDIPALRESAGGLATFAPVGDVQAWAASLADGLTGRLSCPSPPSRSWRTAGQELVAALPS